MEVGLKTRFERFIELLDEEIEKRPHEGVREAFGKILAAFHSRRLPLTPEDFNSFVLRTAQRLPATLRFYVLLILSNAYSKLIEESEVRV